MVVEIWQNFFKGPVNLKAEYPAKMQRIVKVMNTHWGGCEKN